MIVAPVINEQGQWEVLARELGETWKPLPFGMRFRAATKEEANNRAYTVSEQLGSLGFHVKTEEAE